MKGGVGIAAVRRAGVAVAAVAAVNALGDVRAADGTIIAGARAPGGGFVDATTVMAAGPVEQRIGDLAPGHTTLGIVAVDAPLSRVELAHVATAAGAALFRRITPAGTSLDGDVIFAVCPAAVGARPAPAAIHVEALAVEALGSAIERGVRTARGRDGIPGLADAGEPAAIGAQS
jgi:L-aminopeptidase/D-esterase-like protein